MRHRSPPRRNASRPAAVRWPAEVLEDRVLLAAGAPDDLVGFRSPDGPGEPAGWFVGVSNGSRFVTTMWAEWAHVPWRALDRGDFDADGRTDVIGMIAGTWWVGLSTGSAFVTGLWGVWAHDLDWRNALVGDLNADGRDDLVARAGGSWYGALSNGTGFEPATLWAVTADVPADPSFWNHSFLADVDADGRDDLLLFADGVWYVGLSAGTAFSQPAVWAVWADVDYRRILVGDFDADDRADVVGFVFGEWYVGRSAGAAFETKLLALWALAEWDDPLVGDRDGDGRDDIFGRSGGVWYVGLTQADLTATTSYFATWADVGWLDVKVGDFTGDGRADVAGRVFDAGPLGDGTTWWVASPEPGIETRFAGRWDGFAWTAVGVARDSPPPLAAAIAEPDEPLAILWSRAKEDEEFSLRLAAAP